MKNKKFFIAFIVLYALLMISEIVDAIYYSSSLITMTYFIINLVITLVCFLLYLFNKKFNLDFLLIIVSILFHGLTIIDGLGITLMYPRYLIAASYFPNNLVYILNILIIIISIVLVICNRKYLKKEKESTNNEQ